MVNPINIESKNRCHVVAIPYPGMGHINPMLNLCKLLISRNPYIHVTFIIPEEWLINIGSDSKLDTIRFATVPNVLPSQNQNEAVMTNLEAPFEQVLDKLELPVTAIIGDFELSFVIELGNRRNIPVAAFWTKPVTLLSTLYYFQLCAQNQESPFQILVETAGTIPGISSSNLEDLRAITRRDDLRIVQNTLECVLKVSKAQYLLFNSVHELEAKATDTLQAAFRIPVYPIGPAIPYLQLQESLAGAISNQTGIAYKNWLDSQPENSVLYISLGSFLSASKTQMDEMIAGFQETGVRILWVARDEAARLQGIFGDQGLVVPWCDQLKVLCHSSVGGFWSHCGWNSTLEAVFAGKPMLTFPLFLDQDQNSRQIVDEWETGWRVEGEMREGNLVTRKEISQLVRKFMDLENSERKEIKRRAENIREMCQLAITEGGSSVKNIDEFIQKILQGNCQ